MFKKQFFPAATIKSIATNESVYNQGLELFNEDQVKNLSINEKQRSVEFTISDSGNPKTYISFLKNGLAQKYSCNCADFQKRSGACRHVIASMLLLNSYNQEEFDALGTQELINTDEPSGQLQLLQRNRETLNHLFDEARQSVDMQMISFSKRPLQFEFVLNMYQVSREFEYEVYLKVGVDHLYVVNDIVDVTNHLLKGMEYTFGKQLVYKAQDYSIIPEDRKILAYLNEIGKIQEETFSMVHGGRTPEKRGALSLPARSIPELLKLLIEVDGGFVRMAPPPRLLSSINQMETPEVMPAGEKIPITFNLTEQEDHFLLDINEDDKEKNIQLHPQANILSVGSTFYLLSLDDFNNARLLIETFKEMNKQALQLTKSDLTSFYSLIVPKLKEMFYYNVEAEIEDQVKKEELKPELYIDYADERITIEPLFKYGEHRFNPLMTETERRNEIVAEDEHTTIIVRDAFNEADIKNVLSHFFKHASIASGKYILKRFDEISLFLYESLPEITELMDVYLTKDVQELVYDVSDRPSVSIEMNRSTNLLDIRFDVADIPEAELPNLVKQLQKSEERFYKLNSGKIIDLKNKRFDDFIDSVNKLELDPDEITSHSSVSLLRGLTLVEEENVEIGAEFKEFVKDLKEPENLTFEIPKNLNATLRPYQETGFKWLSMLDYYGLGGVLADDMGLGKTIQSITFILSKIEKEGGKYLIVSPSSVIYNWEREFKQFAPKVKSVVISGSIEEREALFKEAIADEDVNVLITSYPLIQRDIEFYKTYTFKSIILDESQNVKNDAAKTTKAVKALQANNIFALSGTPIENNLNELWSLFSIVLPGLFRSKKAFSSLSEEEIAQKIEIFVLRRLKEDVLEDLPPKTETVEYIELSDEQKQLYQTQLALIRNDVEELIEQDAFEQNRMRVLAGMTRLRQICCDPRLIDEEYTGGSAKLERLMEYLREALTNNKRVVLFSQFTSMLAIIRDILDDLGVDYHYLDGSTPKMDRLELTTRFNEGEKDLFLISLRAGGTGLNLTGGDTVILYDSWWNPAIEDQAADRVHRFGQKKSVQVIRMIMQGTIEEGINELQDQKRELIDTVIRKNDEKKTTSLTKEDILNLLTT